MLMNNILAKNVYIYQWEMLSAIRVSSRAGILSPIYKKIEKEDITNYKPISLLDYDYKIYIEFLKSGM